MKKFVLLFAITIFSTTAIYGKPPVRMNQVVKELKQHIKRTPKYRYSHLPNHFKVKFNNVEEFQTTRRDLITYPYYLAEMHVFCKGKFGQIVRESVTVYYIKTGGIWISDGIFWDKTSSKLISGPTKKFKKPADDMVLKLFKKTITGGKDLNLKIIKLELDENPRFAVKGENFSQPAYIYSLGDIDLKVKAGKFRYKGVTLDVVFNKHHADKWQMKINAKGSEKIK